MKEFVSVKVSSFDHDALATTLTSKSADGWDVVGIVSVNSDIVAYLSRETTARPVDGSSDIPRVASEPAGWGAASSSIDASSTPTQAVATTQSSANDSNSTASTVPSVPADWYKDPSGRFDYRYWDGQKWTEHVSRGGTVHKDPPTP